MSHEGASPRVSRRTSHRRVRAVLTPEARLRRGALGALAALALLVIALESGAGVSRTRLPLTNADVIRTQADAKHLDPALIAAVIYAESKFEPRTSPAGAEGLMQIEPETAIYIARLSGGSRFTVSDLATPSVNVAYGSYYLRYLLNAYHGDLILALAAYNAGESNVDRWVGAARDHGQTLTVNDIPFPETRAYVARVLHARDQYRHKYASQLYG
jgi:soluble lytic murein transglycosylase